ncbi:XrtA/PEP-CTERM system TPR-repeat protein PrsT [Plasticicumulans acidivorans]|uniref:Putative PEP-CTERM system TPR-repeat lipoprotein n=1 Tax=Plasticicumulans acidivorans TaxID=886464 RepID=A0A317MS34_9GAMM|nr:XrtA/PEP-CTERM system TPR-repeat protein PrsT [Plasticicumulans acidivorans]PWV58836.1 putative PEP-CTERM system TPR-repeat lipoprotein [Plasticicumulans acidivorans]
MSLSCKKKVFFLVLALITACSRDLSDAEYLKKAVLHQEAGDLSAAQLEFKNAIRVNPNNAEARRLLGLLYLQVGDGAGAEKELQRAKELKVSSEALALPMVEAIFRQKDYRRLLAMRIDGRLPAEQRAEWYAWRGRSQLEMGNLKEAGDEFMEGERLNKDSAQIQLGQSLMALFTRDYKKADALTDELLLKKPNFPEALSLKGDIKISMGALDEALAFYTKAIAARRNNLMDYVKRAQIYLDTNRLQDAKNDIDHVAQYAPKAYEVVFLKGVLAYREEHFDIAENLLRTAVQMQPNSTAALTYFGVILVLRGQPMQAEEAFQQVLVRQPNNFYVTRLLARLYLNQNAPVKAENILKRFSDVGYGSEEFVSLYAESLLRSGDLSNGKSFAERWTQLDPNSARALVFYGSALLASGNESSARDVLEKAINIDPKNNTPDLVLVRVLLKEGKYDQALQAVERWRNRLPNDMTGFLALGQTQLALGNREAARDAFLSVVERSPDNSLAQRNLAAMDLGDQKPEDARARYELIIKLHPDNVQAAVALAGLDIKAGKTGDAVNQLQTVVKNNPTALLPRLLLATWAVENGRPENAIELLRAVESEHGEKTVWLIGMAEALLATGDSVGVRSVLARLPSGLQAVVAAKVAYLRAKAYSLEGDKAQVTASLEQAHALDANNMIIGIALMRAYVQEAQYNKAKKVLADLDKRYPNSSELSIQRAWMEVSEGDVSDAISRLEKAYAQEPSKKLLLELVKAKVKGGNAENAISLLRKWISESKQHAEDIDIVLELSTLLTAIGLEDQAIQLLDGVVNNGVHDWRLLNNLAWLLTESRPSDARKYAEEAVANNPSSAAVRDTLGVILAKQKAYDEAVRAFDEGLRLSNGDAAIRLHKVEALLASGRAFMAESELNKIDLSLSAQKDPQRTKALSDKVAELRKSLVGVKR